LQLTHAQRSQFVEQGYVHVPGVIPRVMVDAALRAINHSVGEGMNVAEMTRFRAQSYCPELQQNPVITDLLNATPALGLAESMIGAGQIAPATHGQIALRFPTMQDPPAAPRPHLDGMHTPTNGVPAGEIYSFTMLLGVLLSDLHGPFAGNLAVWPGTHHIYERYFRERGPQSLLNGMPDVPIPEPVQLTGAAGDIVLCHYELAHGVATNVSPHVRYAIYFRLSHVQHASQKWDAMTNIWMEWAGLQELVSK
jgi:ectoine hydroxylase-related dioxygenase (phytanoyl-CoA dioxygenase family)